MQSQPTFLSHVSTSLPILIASVVATLIIYFGPLLFLPLTKLRWLLLSMPFIALGIITGSPNYLYPGVMALQYSSMILPMVFLGFLDTLANPPHYLIGFKKWLIRGPGLLTTWKNKYMKKGNITNFAIASVIILLVGSIAYQPYSPVNAYTNENYHFSKDVNFNMTNYKTLEIMVSLIPKNNPYVLFQNDMPELLPRQSVDSNPFLFSTQISANITVSEVINNTFPLLDTATALNHTVFVNVDYLIAFSLSSSYTLRFSPHESSMSQLVSLAIESNMYQIVKENNGFILLKRI
jgi:hypothetical protein